MMERGQSPRSCFYSITLNALVPSVIINRQGGDEMSALTDGSQLMEIEKAKNSMLVWIFGMLVVFSGGIITAFKLFGMH